jgi:magnesium transporter
MQNILSYNEREVRKAGSKDDIRRGYNVWIDLVDPTEQELSSVQQALRLDAKALEEYAHESKRPHVRILDNHTFTLMLDMKYDDVHTLVTEGIYMFLGSGWLVTIHSPKIDLAGAVSRLLQERGKPIMESSIDALYYNILSNMVDRYEQLLTAIELSVTDIERKSVYRPTKKMLEYLDDISRQIIILRRHFWHIRDIINFLTHVHEDRQDVKYLKITYDDINQLIELVESYQDTVNSTRELYIANVSLQMNDTVKTLTIFSAVLLPLTFISSVYGMNGLDLNNIWSIPVGFTIVMITMAAVAAGLFVFFKKKKWIFVREMIGNGKEEKQKQGHDSRSKKTM